MENSEVVQLYLDDIIPNRFQPREVFNDQALKELAISIREHGVIQPILVRKFGEKYEIIAGERRYKASTMAGLTKIPAIVKNLDDKESSKVALIENLQRRDLTPIEEARTYQKILDLDEMTQEELAKTMGKSQSAVSNKLRLLSLPDEIQEALLKEEISERHARSLLNVDDKNIQIDLLKEIVNNKMTVRELDLKIKKLSSDENDTTTDNNNVDGGSNNTFEVYLKEEIGENKEKDIPTVDLFTSNEDSSNSEKSLVEDKVNIDSPAEKLDTNNSSFNTLFDSNKPEGNLNNDLFNETPVDASNKKDDLESLFGDPTSVNIDKIREQSTDINPVVPEKETADIKSLLKPDGFKEDSSTFVKIFDEENKNLKDTQVSNKGLLSEMPPIESISNTGPENKINDETLSSTPSDNIVEEKKESAFSSLFDTAKEETIKEENNNSLFGSNQNAVNSDTVISSSNVQGAVSEVRDVIKSYQDKGYSVTIEELDLDREIQLIIKFNKN